MSRIGDVAENIKEELQQRFPRERVELFFIPHHTYEDLAEKRRILVRYWDQGAELNQGPDKRMVYIDVGCVGIAESRHDSDRSYDEETLRYADEMHALYESVRDLWIGPDAPVAPLYMADHRFADVERVAAGEFDHERYYQQGIFARIFRLVYENTED